jgi:hypothetical protein
MAATIKRRSIPDVTALRATLEYAIAQWDRRQRNPHAGAIALQRLDKALVEHEAGKSLAHALYRPD